MKKWHRFSIARFRAMLVKEFIQMRRDRLTFGMMVGIPLLQLVLFGYAINADPKHLPAAVILADHGPEGRTLLSSLQNSGYYNLVRQVKTEVEGHDLLARGQVQFVVNIPENFSRDFVRGDRPELLVEADATDPGTTGNAIGSLSTALNMALQNDLKGPLESLAVNNGPIDLRVHSLYNPEAITQYNIVPGLMGVVLTLTMILVTGLAITRERERGTMENLLSMPTRPIEVLIGKLVPYILVGYIQVGLILFAARFLFHVPMFGSLALLLTAAAVFIIANLAVGITRNARLGPDDRPSPPPNSFCADRPRRSFEGQRSRKHWVGTLAHRTLRGRRHVRRDETLSADTGLKERLQQKGTDYKAICHRSDWSDRAGDCSAVSRKRSSCNRVCSFA